MTVPISKKTRILVNAVWKLFRSKLRSFPSSDFIRFSMYVSVEVPLGFPRILLCLERPSKSDSYRVVLLESSVPSFHIGHVFLHFSYAFRCSSCVASCIFQFISIVNSSICFLISYRKHSEFWEISFSWASFQLYSQLHSLLRKFGPKFHFLCSIHLVLLGFLWLQLLSRFLIQRCFLTSILLY